MIPPWATRPARARRHRRAGLAVVLLVLAGPALVLGCATVSGELPAAADQPWQPLATATASDVQDPDATASLPTDLVPPMIPLPAPESYPADGPLRAIFDRGQLRVGVSRDTQLRGAWDPVEQRFEGFDVDLARRIAAALFGVSDPDAADTHLRPVPVSYAERLPAIEQDKVDIVISTLTYTRSRARRVGLSAAYFTAYPSFLSHAAPPAPGTAPADGPGIDTERELVGKRVCAPRATTSLNNLREIHARVGGFEMVGHLNELSDCLLAFQQGDVDVVAANDASLVGMLEQDATAVLGGFQGGDPEYYSVAFRRGDTELAGFVNGVLEGIRRDPAAWLALCTKWEVRAVMPCSRSLPPEPLWAAGG